MSTIPESLFKKIRRIQIQTTRFAEDLLAGAYRSAFKGKGMEFEEVREYQPGDDIRSIDWNVTARMNKPYVKSFREERELHVILAVDVSASTRFGSGRQLKRELIAEIAAAIAFSALKNNDKTALILFSDRIEYYLPPKKGTRHVLRMIRELLTAEPQGRNTDIGAALAFLGQLQMRAGICFLISDFIAPDYSKEAKVIAKRHDLVPLAIMDPAEKIIPQLGLASLTALEEDETILTDTDSRNVASQLMATAEERLVANRKLMRQLGTELCVLETGKPYLSTLRRYFTLRKQCFR